MTFASTYKIVLFGDSQTGKTTLAHRFLTNLFKETVTMTLGVDFHLKPLEIDGEMIKLQIWDFAGEERFRFLFPSYVRGANGAIFMYDTTNYGSLAHVDDWFEIVENEIKCRIPIVFVGGKTDLIHLKEVPTKKAMELAISKGADGFIECSSKTGENINKIFNLLAKIIIKCRNNNMD
ncbi:MAG: Rab family GTPase [Candidatus Thorarchaeota archaeon]